MIQANSNILDDRVKSKCADLGIDIYPLKNSKANTLAFSTNNHRRREFEITFLTDEKYRISTRFLGYRSVFDQASLVYICSDDPDGRRKSYSVETDDRDLLNVLILKMIMSGYEKNPRVELV